MQSKRLPRVVYSQALACCIQVFSSDTYVQQVGSTEKPVGKERCPPYGIRALLPWVLGLPATSPVALASEYHTSVPDSVCFPGLP